MWASGLRQLALGDFFDQALNEVVWPANLERLSLGSKFNQVCVCFFLFSLGCTYTVVFISYRFHFCTIKKKNTRTYTSALKVENSVESLLLQAACV